MFNKFKKGDIVCVHGTGKNDKKFYKRKIGRVVQKDDFFCDYLISFKDGTTDWLDEWCLKLVEKKESR